MSPISGTLCAAGRYRLDERVACGRVADVWQATDLRLARPVAVKLLHAELGWDAGAVGHFRDAAYRAASMVHEGIARVFDYSEPDEQDAAELPFLVMEFVDGPSLAGLLASGPLDTARAMDVLAQAAAALDFAHRAGIVHGDLGPHSILVHPDGTVKLVGFAGAHAQRPGPGTADDVAALGVVAYLCLTGLQRPNDQGVPALPRQIPGPVTELVSQMTAPEPGARPASLAEVCRRAAELRDRLAPPRPASAGPAGTGHPTRPLSAAIDSVMTAILPPAAGKPWRPSASRQRGLLAVRASAVIAVAMAIAVFGVLRPEGLEPRASGTTKITTVQVDPAALIGRPVKAARRRLERLGLVVLVRWQPSDRVSPDRVLSVRPSGRVPAHSRITLIGSLRPPLAASGEPVAPRASKPAQHRPAAARVSQQAPRVSAAPLPAPSPAGSPAPSPAPTGSPSPSSSPSPVSSPPPTSPPPSG